MPFDHEKLQVYKRAIEFAGWADQILQQIPKSISVWDQLDRASTSIALNIAEGNGKFTSADRCRYFDTARGSALECSACLDILVAKQKMSEQESGKGKEELRQIVSMLVGLIKSNNSMRLHDEPLVYRVSNDETVVGED